MGYEGVDIVEGYVARVAIVRPAMVDLSDVARRRGSLGLMIWGCLQTAGGSNRMEGFQFQTMRGLTWDKGRRRRGTHQLVRRLVLDFGFDGHFGFFEHYIDVDVRFFRAVVLGFGFDETVVR